MTPRPTAFHRAFGTERQCRRFLFQKKWTNGFRCPRCQHRRALERLGGRKWVCGRRGCTYWESPTTGTIAESIKKPLRLWFWGLWLYTHARGGMTASRLKEELGLGSYQTAWTWCHKYRAAIEANPEWASALYEQAPRTPGHQITERPMGLHGWRGRQGGLIAKFGPNHPRSNRLAVFASWLLALNEGRVSAKHGQAYWIEYLFWLQIPSGKTRWASMTDRLACPAIPYWRLVGRLVRKRPLDITSGERGSAKELERRM